MTRYASGEEPMVGDVFAHQDCPGREFCAVAFSEFDNGVHGVVTENRVLLSVKYCTLIRRGETERCRLSDTCDLPRNHGPACRVLLGLDRNGREVRRGMRAKSVHSSAEFTVLNGNSTLVGGVEDNGDNRSLPWFQCELVDEKAERCERHDIRREWDGNCTACQYDASCPTSWASLVGDNPVALWTTRRINYDCDWPGSGTVPIAVLEAIESFSRWLARPTMAERFEAFRERITTLLEGYPALKVTFDCDDRGPTCFVRHPVFREMTGGDWYGFNECASDETVQRAVTSWADWLGRKALAK